MSNELKPCPSVWKNKDITPEPYGETNMIVVLRENELYGEYWQMLGFYEYDTVRKTTVKWCYLDDLLNTRPDDDLRERNRELENGLLSAKSRLENAAYNFGFVGMHESKAKCVIGIRDIDKLLTTQQDIKEKQ